MFCCDVERKVSTNINQIVAKNNYGRFTNFMSKFGLNNVDITMETEIIMLLEKRTNETIHDYIYCRK